MTHPMNPVSVGDDLEIWATIPEWEAYEVSNKGRIRKGSKEIKQHINHRGYPQTSLWKGGKSKSFGTHRLVLMGFIGPCPDGFEGAHLDGVKSHNFLKNLAWVSTAENARQRVEDHKTQATAEGHGSAKLTWEKVRLIRSRISQHGPLNGKWELVDELGVCADTIRKVARRILWKHDPLEQPPS